MSPIDTRTNPGNMLLDQLRSAFTPEIFDRLSLSLGESHEKVRTGIMVAIPIMLAALVKKGATEHGASSLINSIQQFGLARDFAPRDADQIVRDTSPGGVSPMRQNLIDAVLGGHAGAVSQLLGRASGLSTNSVSAILGMLAPMALGAIGRHVSSGNMDARALSELLDKQKPSIAAALPAEMRSALGFSNGAKTGWHPWALAAAVFAAVLGAGYLMNRNRENHLAKEVEREAAELTDKAKQEAAVASSNVERFFEAAKHPTTPGAPVRMTFTGITFATDEASLEPQSMHALDEVAEGLKNNPTVKVSLEGHTDNTGDPIANKNLSLARAATVRRALIARGIDENRLAIVGWGDEKPIADNNSASGREQNRRLEVVAISSDSEATAH